MKCPKCGTKYEGSRCPDCGRLTDPRDETKQRNKKIRWIVASIIIGVGLISISCYYIGLHNIVEDIKALGRNVPGEQETISTVSHIETENAEEPPEIISELENYLDQNWDGESLVRTHGKNLDVTLCASGNISDFLEAAQAIASEINSRIEDMQDITGSSVLVKSGLESTSEIYITFLNGKLSFRADEAEEYTETNDEFITLDEYNRITIGMSYQEAVNIIGSTGELASSIDIGDYEFKTDAYSWDGKEEFSSAIFTFQGGKVSSKLQYGLE